jgi:zinc transporter ZupT
MSRPFFSFMPLFTGVRGREVLRRLPLFRDLSYGACEKAMNTLIFVSLLAVVVLAMVHLLSGSMRFLEGTPRSVWLSMAGGISVAYVFVHLLPDLAKEQQAIREAVGETFSFLEYHVYLVALIGLAVFYGLERAAKTSRQRRHGAGKEDSAGAGIFWLHIASFIVYNALIGYLLLHREQQGLRSLILFAFAMGVHFVVNDYGLRVDHKGNYERIGRWVLVAGILVGWVVGLIFDVSEAVLGVLFAFLAGGVMMNVLKEELPEERKSRFWAFALGAALYTAILLTL